MQLSVGKHYIQFTIKYTLLKYIISIISTLFKSILKYRPTSLLQSDVMILLVMYSFWSFNIPHMCCRMMCPEKKQLLSLKARKSQQMFSLVAALYVFDLNHTRYLHQ